MYRSKAQIRFFHSAGAAKAGISKKTVEEFDEKTRGHGKNLPERKSMKLKGRIKMKKGYSR